MLPLEVTSTSTAQYHGKQPQPNGGAATHSISQQLLFKLGSGGSGTSSISNNNVVNHKSTMSSNTATTSPGRCHSKHDPILLLASHIIQTLFGNIVQIVADCLQCRGTLSLREIVSYLIPKNDDIPATNSQSRGTTGINRSTIRCSSNVRNNRNGSTSSQPIFTLPQIKAALIVLIQHSIVSTTTKPSAMSSNNNASATAQSSTATGSMKIKRLSMATTTLYRYHPIKAIYMNHRFAKFIEYIRKAMVGNTASDIANTDRSLSSSCILIEELLLLGRLRTIDLIMYTVQRINDTTETADIGTKATVTSSVEQQQQYVIDAMSKLVTSGFIVSSRVTNNKNPDEDMEHEWSDTNDNNNTSNKNDSSNENHRQKRFRQSSDTTGNENDDDTTAFYQGDALSVANLLTCDESYKHILPVDMVWTVNIPIFHDHLRAYYYGKYISERYGQNHFRGSNGETNPQQSLFSCIGSLITAALKYRAYRTYTLTNDPHSNNRSVSYFTVADIMKYVPKSVIQMIEKKNGDSVGTAMNVENSIQQIFCDVCSLDYDPHFLRRISDSYHDSNIGQKQQQIAFEVVLQTISSDYIDRIIYQIVHDRHGAIAARVVSILSTKGYLESDRIADMAMVPAKDTREVLHHLYRSRYIEILQLSNSSRQQYNPNNTIYLWGIERTRLIQRMIDDVAKGLYNIRLRRQHELDTIGAEWMERMTTNQQQQPFSHDHTNNFTANIENIDLNVTSEIDRENYTKFCTGLERLDVAAIQLDETLMALFDFPKNLH